jgi:hypothetical protein
LVSAGEALKEEGLRSMVNKPEGEVVSEFVKCEV